MPIDKILQRFIIDVGHRLLENTKHLKVSAGEVCNLALLQCLINCRFYYNYGHCYRLLSLKGYQPVFEWDWAFSRNIPVSKE